MTTPTDASEGTQWSALFTDANAQAPVSVEDAVPGESTLEDEGKFAFHRDTIRRRIRVTQGALDLRAWFAIVPQVHSSFALSGAQKTVAMLQGTSLVPDDALLDAFASEMASWARDNDPALELSVTALP
jgi:hypothetical protein